MKVSPSIKASDPAAAASVVAPRQPSRLMQRLRKWRGFLLAVVLPTALVATYFYAIAAGQYASEARFLVRGPSGNSSSAALTGALGAVLGGNASPAQVESMAVRDYLRSNDALRAMRQQIDVTSLWRRPEADFIARLQDEQPTVEQLGRYYRRMVTTDFDTESSTINVQVRAFRPGDAKDMAEVLLRISESLVNSLSERQREDTLGMARQEVALAEQRVVAAREQVTQFRQAGHAIDPTIETAANVATVSQMEGALTQARAELREKSGFMRPDNPQIGIVQNRIAALENQIANERRRLTGGQQSAPQQLAGYERLLLEREFADRQLTSAVSGLESARVDVARQQLYVARITQPRVAESALYPRAAFTVGSVFVVLLVVYGIASLILAGFREHAS